MAQETIQVLSIEDNATDARLIEEMLIEATALGWDLPRFELIHASSLAEGLDCLGDEGADIVLTDLDLPDSQAGDTFTRLRAHTQHIPIVVLTGHEDKDLARHTLRAGAQDYLFKREMSGSLLAHALLYAIERQQIKEELARAHGDLEREVQKRTAELRHANEQLRKEMADREQDKEALRESEEKYRSLFNQSVSGIYLHDLEGRILDVNQMACLQSGYSRDELLQMTVFDLHPADSGNMPRDEILRLWHQWEPEQRSIVEGDHQHKDGTVFPIEVSTGVIRYGNRNILLAMVQDITERRRAADERDRLQAQLAQAQKMEAIGRLAGGVAHDFNNMLGVIIGHAELSMRQLDPTHPLYTGLTEIHHAAQRSADLTRQLLAFARKQIIAPVVLDLNSTVTSMLRMLRRLIGEDIELIWLPGSDLWPVKIDRGQFNQILINLCLNARDAIAGQGPLAVGTITVETKNVVCDESYSGDWAGFTPGEYVQLAVSDDGCGMDQATQANLFEPYFTTKVESESGGLGLATVYGAVKMNHGFIHVYSESGEGTTLKIYLPRSEGQVTSRAISRPLLPSRGETVLLVEDEPAILRLASKVLERLGYVVLVADRPGQALREAAAYAGKIDLLVTDVVMPEMNGRDLAAQIETSHPGLKCLFMSGYTANVIAHQGVLDEGVWFLQKPFSIDELANKVREVLEDA